MSEGLKEWIKACAIEHGFAKVGFTSARGHDFSAGLIAYLEKSYQGEMTWLRERTHWRADPSALWPEANSIIMLAESYPCPQASSPDDCGEISSYARNRDYHDVLKKRLKALGRALIKKAGGEIKVFVDTAPVMEKPLAEAAGIGWQGKHGNLLSRSLGNWFFLGSIFTTHELTPDQPETSHCGSCTSCVDACPTDAFDEDGHLDPRKCISYLTIEHAGEIPLSLRKGIGNRIYGCDICLNACPWNKFDTKSNDPRYDHRAELISPPLSAMLALEDASFRVLFSGSPIKRIGWKRFLRNCLIAAGNSKDRSLLAHIAPHIHSTDLIIKDAATWAMEQLHG